MSSIFLKRTYSVCNIMLESEKILEVLIWFFNIDIKEEIILERWKDILGAMIEKGKGLVLRKLRII